MNHMVVRGEDTKKISLDDIAVIIIENTAVSLTCCLLSALIKKKIKVIFCDTQRNPVSELVAYSGCHDDSRKIRTQITWSEDIKLAVWTEIVSDKILKQSEFLEEIGKSQESQMLKNYISEIEFGDASNREGHAAKVYFNALFGMEFTRSKDCPENSALNYGYSIMLSAFNREIVSNGYLTQLGLFHDNMFNHFNLGSDLMEPFRIIVDRKVKKENFTEFKTQEKYCVLEILEQTVRIDNSNQTVLNAIKIYTKSIFDAINDKDLSLIRLIKI